MCRNLCIPSSAKRTTLLAVSHSFISACLFTEDHKLQFHQMLWDLLVELALDSSYQFTRDSQWGSLAMRK
jgi:hypothetical protein